MGGQPCNNRQSYYVFNASTKGFMLQIFISSQHTGISRLNR